MENSENSPIGAKNQSVSSFKKKHSNWVCLKIGYTPNEIAIFHDGIVWSAKPDWVFRGLANIFRQTQFNVQLV